MPIIMQFELVFAARLPETLSILMSAGLVVHPSVSLITLHGSRGLAGNFRPDSDIDLSLLVSIPSPPEIGEQLGTFLYNVLTVTLSSWKSPVQVDLAAIFPRSPCKLACFERMAYDPQLCSLEGAGCFGAYKIQKGFSGFILSPGIRVERMYPCITVWKNEQVVTE